MELSELYSRLSKLEDIIQELATWTGFQIKEKVSSHSTIRSDHDANKNSPGNTEITPENHEILNQAPNVAKNLVTGPSTDSEKDAEVDDAVSIVLKVELEEQENHVDVNNEQSVYAEESSSAHAILPKHEIDDDLLSKSSGNLDPLLNLDNSDAYPDHIFSDLGVNSSPESDVEGPPKKRQRSGTSLVSAKSEYEALTVPSKSSLPPTPPFVTMKKLTSSEAPLLSHRTLIASHIHRRNRAKNRKYSQFSCYFCFKSFTTEHQMKTHLLSHTKERPFRCSKCSFSSTDMPKLRIHIYAAHEKTDFFKCPVCHIQTKNLQEFSIHMRYSHQNFTFKCTLCPFEAATVPRLRRHEWGKHKKLKEPRNRKQKYYSRYKCPQCPHLKIDSQAVLERHLRTHTGERPFPCPHCSYAANIQKTLDMHLRNIHPATEQEEFYRPFLCEQCPKTFKDKDVLEKHIMQCHQKMEKNFLCEYCPYIAKMRGNLNIHIRRAHGGEDARFKCYFCSFICKCYQDLTKHLGGIHTGEKPYKCSHCPYKTNCFSTLKVHTKNLHSTSTQTDDSTKELLKCPKCPCKLTSKAGLINHLKTHYKRKHKCGICEYEAPDANSLKKHIDENHKKGKDFNCPHCSKIFGSKSGFNFVQHLRIHTGEKPFKCDKCQYATGHKPNFKKHEKICKGKERKDTEEMFKCDKCDQEFTSLGNVNRHKAKWHGKNLLQCPHCNHNFKDENKLREHVKIRHAEKSSSEQMEVIKEEPETYADPAIQGMK